MQFLFLLKLFGKNIVTTELADMIAKHVSAAGYAELGTAFAAGAAGCKDQSPQEVAQAVANVLFAIK